MTVEMTAYEWIREAGATKLDDGRWLGLVIATTRMRGRAEDLHRRFDTPDKALAWAADKVSAVYDMGRIRQEKGCPASNTRDPAFVPRPGDRAMRKRQRKRQKREGTIVRVQFHLHSTDVSYITVAYPSGREAVVTHAEWQEYSFRDHRRPEAIGVSE